MTVLSPRATLADAVRSAVVALLAVVQLVAVGLSGVTPGGASFGAVSAAYPTPLSAAGWTHLIWLPIGVGFAAYAVYQLLPAQRHRLPHRTSGWWLAAAAAFGTGWVLAFTAQWLPLAELMAIGLLVSLAVVFGRLSRLPASGPLERALLRAPVAVYTGWVSVLAVFGTAAAGVWFGLPGEGALAAFAAVVVLLVTAAIVSWVVLAGTAVVGYTAAAVWALLGIALNDPPVGVAVAAAMVIAVGLAASARRIMTAGSRTRAALG